MKKEPITWTTDFPPEDGYYWYREDDGCEDVIVEVDNRMGWIYFSYDDRAAGPDMIRKITGKFWPIKLTPPE